MRKITYKEAITEALKQSMEKDNSIYVYGAGVDDADGIFGTGVGLSKFFGKQRVLDVPVSENALTGIGIGSAMTGMKPIFVHQRIDFTLLTLDQLINHASKYHYMYGGKVNVPIVIRAIIGRGWGQGSQHSQSFHSLFAHFPGLKVVLPSNAHDAKGLLIESIKDKNPTIFIEHKFLMNNIDNVPKKPYTIKLGKGEKKLTGKHVTLVCFSLMVEEALKAASILKKEKIDCEVIDLRTSFPLDEKIIIESVKKTGRLIVCDIDWINCGISGEIVSRVVKKCFSYLKKPPERIGLPFANHPSSYSLENAFFPNYKNIIKSVKEIVNEA
jgi:acetoin:2,6-dichlorophenolindophenol oxidoreductase subunit beta